MLNLSNRTKCVLLSVCLIVVFVYIYFNNKADDDKIKSKSEKTDKSGETVNSTILVTTTSGQVAGQKVFVDDVEANVFMGIEYATAKRFEYSKRSSWEGVRDAVAQPPICPQQDLLPELSAFKFLNANISEDCLFLNVFAPAIDSTDLKPIIVYIHSGIFSFGGIATEELDGRVLATKNNVIVITIQYRLGALGFLDFDGESQNFGLRDQATALQWIRDNAAGFGGDGQQITVVGHGAASLSVLALANEYLYDRAILHGGELLSARELLLVKFKNASTEFMNRLNCTFNKINCLKEMSVGDIIEFQSQIWENATLIFGPNIEMSDFNFNLQGSLLINLNSEDDFIADGTGSVCNLIKLCNLISANSTSLKLYKIEDFSSPHDEVVFALGIPLEQKHVFDKEEKQLSRFLGSLWSQFAVDGNVTTSTGQFWPDYNKEDKRYLKVFPKKRVVQHLDENECPESLASELSDDVN